MLAYVDGLTVREVVDAMRGLDRGDDPNRRRHPELEPRTVRMELPPETCALFLEARRKLEKDLGHPMTDADFVTAACAAVLCGGVRDDGGATAPRHQIAMVVCEQCRRSWHDAPGRSIEVPASTVERARCDAIVLGQVDGETNTPPDASRTIPAPTRRAVLARDHHRCRVPGCTLSVYVDVHHIDPFGQGGNHAMPNLITLCTLHHKLHHDGVITIAGTASALTVTHADGRPYGTQPGALRSSPPSSFLPPAAPPTTRADRGTSPTTRADRGRSPTPTTHMSRHSSPTTGEREPR